jgi:acetyl esterase
VHDHPAEFDIDPKRIALAGESVGGNQVAVVAIMAKERGGPALRAQAIRDGGHRARCAVPQGK